MDDKTIQRFWSKMDKSGECWLWMAGKTRGGYGKFTVCYKQLYAHRIAYELSCGPIPEGLCVCHRCDNPACCNPAHLWIGTQADNIADRDRKGRGSWGTQTTPEQRAISSERTRAQWANPEMRAKIVAANRAASQRASLELRERRLQNLVRGSSPGRNRTDAQRAQLSVIMKERMSDPDIRARISATLKGRKRKAV